MTSFASQLALASIVANLRMPEVSREVLLNQPADPYPIVAALVARNLVGETASERFTWADDAEYARRTQVNNAGAAYDATTTAIVVDDANMFYPESLVYCEATGEIMYCTAVNAGTNTLTVVRGVGETALNRVAAAAGSVADDAWLINIGHAGGEGANAPAARMSGPTERYNFVQSFRKRVEITGRASRIKTLTEDEKNRQILKMQAEHLSDIEHSILFGVGEDSVNNAGGRRASASGGLERAITTYVDAVGGTMTMARWDTAAATLFARGSRHKLFVVGYTLASTINTLYKNSLRTENGSTAVGLQITTVTTPYGILHMVPSQRLVGPKARDGFAIDLEANVMLKYTGEGRTRLRDVVLADGADASAVEWFTEMGFQWGLQANHARITGVTGPA